MQVTLAGWAIILNEVFHSDWTAKTWMRWLKYVMNILKIIKKCDFSETKIYQLSN